ncbi:glucose-1-phosphate thymidylyltransferase [Effusibacillus lacus]|uniref:Glucose-1-phosphate thymidylyltransferase n=1 Tax=Effusibacillus lacus TaxID=1348429 RepID=A0A292YS07_9BACL|nr:glucose-1-phosphate thymidylyltransferase [Effusibacillus lacus]TCS73539.1 glucose-1-phosphate thymidylyltransferase [Effusibacillus lacus]GAX91966.1 glucose-1-phosphate thymidylyltransferase [Effusibacillus lacus]
MKGLILCGGRGTRLRPYSYSRPKHLLPVANRPVIAYVIDKMRQAGIREIGIVVPPYFRFQFEEVLGQYSGDVALSFIEQPEAKGLAHAVGMARDFIGNDPFLLFLGDNFYDGKLNELIERFRKEGPEALLLVSQVQNPSQFGVVEFKGSQIVRLWEKPKDPPSSYAIIGVYILTPKIFDVIDDLRPSARGEYELTDAIQGLIDKGYAVTASPCRSWWKDTGQPKDLLACNRQVLLNLQGEIRGSNVTIVSSMIQEPVVIETGAYIEDSVIRGPVSIGIGARIIRSYVGPFTSVGEGVHLVDAEIENSIVLNGSHVKKVSKRIDESIIGSEVQIEGSRGNPRSIRMNVGDHTTMFLPIEDE